MVVQRLKTIAHVVAGQSPSSDDVKPLDEGIPFIQGNAEFGSLHPTPKWECNSATKFAEPGDILISVRAPVGEVNIADSKIGIGRGLAAIRPKDMSLSKWLYFALLSNKEYLNSIATGSTFTAVTTNDIGNIRLTVPGNPQDIADQLDRELSDIDEFIADQKCLQDLSTEHYFSQLHQLVTKGVNNSPNLTDTNIDWIGSIPSHWSLQKIGWLFNDIGSGTTPSTSDQSALEAGTINWVTTGELRETGISKTKHQINQETLSRYSALKIHPANSILIAMYGATIGRLGWLEEPATTNQAVCALSNPTNVLPKYAFYALIAARQHILTLASGGGQPNINQDIIRNLKVPVPPIEEQE